MSIRARYLALFSLVFLPTCKDGGGPDVVDAAPVEVGALPDGIAATTAQDVAAGAGTCALQLYRQFSAEAATLKSALDSWAAAPLDPATRASAQQTWRQAMQTWQQLEIFQFGPAASSRVPAGQDIRDLIYSYPNADRCRVESLLARDLFRDAAVRGAHVAYRGLDALEALLFLQDTTNVCPTNNDLVQMPWSMLDADTLNQRRAAYAQILGDEIAAAATALVTAWEPTGGNFLAKLQMPSGTPFSSAQAALNAVSDALFYLETQTKDMKIGPGLGLTECASCTTPFESMWSQFSKTNALNNVLGFRRLFSGCALDGAGPGFKQLLWTRGAGDLAERIDQHLAATQLGLQSLQSTDLAAAVVAERPQVQEVYNQLKALKDILQSQFISVLNLNLPMNLPTDND